MYAKPFLAVIAAGAFALPAATCPTETFLAAVATDDAEDELQAIIDEYTDAYSEFMTAYRSASTDEERQKIVGEKLPDIDPYAARVLAFVKANPDSEAAWTGIQWITGRGSRSSSAAEATQFALENYIDDERLGDICLSFSRRPGDDATVQSLQQVIKQSPHHEVRGKACFALGMVYKSMADAGSRIQTTGLKPKTKVDSADWNKKFIAQMQLVVDEYKDVSFYRGTLGAKATGELFEVQNLQIGMLAPDIEGEDLDGVPFKLSEYNGKVVVLDFWGNW